MNIRWGLVGTNFITSRFLSAWTKVPGMAIQAVYSRSLEKAREWTRGTDAHAYDQLDALASDPAVDAVYIASPTALHHPQTLQMLRAGKHVFCEKPLASNAHEAREMAAEARKSRLVLMEGIRPIHHPGLQMVQEHMKHLGTLRRVSLSYCQYSSRYDAFRAGVIENAFRPELSNGAAMDLGIYCVHVMIRLLGMPLEVLARAVFLSNGVDGLGTALAMYPGFQAELHYSKISSSTSPCEIQGEDGTLTFSPLAAPEKITLHLRGNSPQELLVEGHENDMVYEIQAFCEAIKSRETSLDTLESSVQALELMDRIRLSAGICFPADRVISAGIPMDSGQNSF